MEQSTNRKIRVGIFTLAGILLFLVGIFVIGNKKNMFTNTFNIYGHFKNVGGLAIGNNIRFAGITVGTVEAMSIVSDTIVRVDMRIKEDVKQFLKADAKATIGSDGLMGDKLITILPGTPGEQKFLAEEGRIKTEEPVDFDQVLGKFTVAADNARVITSELASMAVQVRTGNGTLNKLLYSDDLSNRLEGTSVSVEKLASSLAGMTDHIRSGKGSVGSLLYTDTLSNQVNRTMITIHEAAYGFNENMKALHENFLFRGYFKRKAKKEEEGKDAKQINFETDSIHNDMDSTELVEIISEAQKALEAKRKGGN